MKTSVLEVHDMLSVLSVDELEKQIGEVPGVESTTVNFAAKSATVRYDETRLEISDIKSAVRQRAYASPSHSAASSDGQKDHASPPAPSATPSSTSPKPASNSPGIAGPATTSQDKAVPSAPKPPASPPHAAAAPASATPKSPPGAAAPAAPGGHDHSDKEPPKKA